MSYVGIQIGQKELKFKFLNMSVPILPVYKAMVKPRVKMFLKVEAPLFDETSRVGIIKLLGLDEYDILTMKVTFERNKVF